MRLGLIHAVTIALATAGAHAGSSVTITPMDGSLGVPFDNGPVHGFTYGFPESPVAGSAPPFNLYDNIPSILGGTSDTGFCGPFGEPCSTYVFMDWNEPSAQFGDDLHGIAPHAVVTSLWYGYSLPEGMTTTHRIKIYDMVPPSATHGTITAAIRKGALLTVVTVAAIGGQNYVSVGVPSVHLPHTAVWIKFEEVGGTGFPNTTWLTGGYPGIGNSHFGLTSTHKDPTSYGGTSTYNLWIPVPYFIFSDMMGGNVYVISNIAVGLNGYVPVPAAIGVLGLGGLLALRRRRDARA